MVGAGTAGCVLTVQGAQPAQAAFALFLLLAFAVPAAFFSMRLYLFRGRLCACLRRLRDGDFSTGIHQNAWLRDDVSELTVLVNESVDRLALFDELRTDRVALHFRALETILRTVDMAVMLVDASERTLRPNPFLQRAFATSRDTFTFEELERLPENAQLMELVRAAVYREQAVMDGPARLKLLATKNTMGAEVRVVPLKDRADVVRVALAFVMLLDPEEPGDTPAGNVA
jgi:hypothetical protein